MRVTPFASDLAFLRSHTSPLLLGEAPGPQIVVAPEYQGRVLTSTVGGESAPSFGWLGRAAISSHARQPHMNVFGGEDRFWLGPEGGQFALYFKKGDAFDLAHWQVPEGFDWGSWDVVTPVGGGRAVPETAVARATTRTRRSKSKSTGRFACSRQLGYR